MLGSNRLMCANFLLLCENSKIGRCCTLLKAQLPHTPASKLLSWCPNIHKQGWVIIVHDAEKDNTHIPHVVVEVYARVGVVLLLKSVLYGKFYDTHPT